LVPGGIFLVKLGLIWADMADLFGRDFLGVSIKIGPHGAPPIFPYGPNIRPKGKAKLRPLSARTAPGFSSGDPAILATFS
jgi:hypothetical protein